jgi:RNA polymerase sigma-70 factor, ECF subfamily
MGQTNQGLYVLRDGKIGKGDSASMGKTNPAGMDFKAIYATFAPKIKLYLRRLAGEIEAEDLTQEVFSKVSRGLDTFRGESRLSTWIYRVATYTAIDSIRKKQVQPTCEALVELSEQSECGKPCGREDNAPEQQIIHNEMNTCIRDTVFSLPEIYHAVIILSELEGFRDEEIAEILEISREAVKIRLHRGRAKLKEALSKKCILYRDERNEFVCDKK